MEGKPSRDLKVYVGIPKEFETQETSRIPEAEPTNITRVLNLEQFHNYLDLNFKKV